MLKQELSDIDGNPQNDQQQPPVYTEQPDYLQQGQPQQGYVQPSYPKGHVQPSYPQGHVQPSYPQGHVQHGYGYDQPSCTTNTVIVNQPQTSTVIIMQPSDYLGLSFFTCLCCCLPIGIAALIYSWASREAFIKGDTVTSASKGSTARTLNIIGIICGVLIITGTVLMRAVFFAHYYETPTTKSPYYFG